VFFGGARGAGKTDCALGEWALHAQKYGKNARGIFFRRYAKDLEDVIRRSLEIYNPAGRYVSGNVQEWRFHNGATLKFRDLKDVNAASKIQGSSCSRMYFEELTQWSDLDAMKMALAALRSAEGVPIRVMATGNPGGPGHQPVRARYVSPAPRGYKIIKDADSGQLRVFIPGRLEDNKKPTENDPEYERRLLASGPAALVKAWRWGDWDIVAGGFFDDIWSPDRHILKPFEPPEGWTFRRSFDWGYSAPSACGFFAISDGTPLGKNTPYPGRVFPRGSAIQIGEMYTIERDEHGAVRPNVGAKRTPQELGQMVARLSRGRHWTSCVSDNQIFDSSRGPSLYEQMRQGARAEGHSLIFHAADKNRIAGWQRMREMLIESGKERPEKSGLWIFDTCTETIRTVPVLQRDERLWDDVDSDAEDHAGDCLRYLIQSIGRRVVTHHELIL